MADKDDPNLTIGPHEARRQSTRIMRAIQETAGRKAAVAQNTPVSPVALFWIGMVRNFVLGIPFTGIGFIWAYRTVATIEKATEPLMVKDLLRFVPSAAFLLIGLAFLAPTQTETALRFIGLGGIVDRLPFLKPKSQENAS